jgi:hypothetical protein
VLETAGAGAKYLQGKVVTVGSLFRQAGDGPVYMNSGQVQVLPGGSLVFTASGWFQYLGGTVLPAVINGGLLINQASAGFGANVPLQAVDAQVIAQSGVFQFDGGSDFSGTTRFDVGAAGGLLFDTNTHVLRDSVAIEASGEFRLAGATFDFAGDTTALSGGALLWDSGTLANGGLRLHGELVLRTAGGRLLNSLALDNRGTVRQTGGGPLRFLGAAVDNRGLWRIEDDSAWEYWGGALGRFSNHASLVRALSAGTATVGANVALQQNALLSVESGALSVQSNGQHQSGNWTVLDGAALVFPTATQSFSGTQTGSCAGSLSFAGATVDFAAGSVWQIGGQGTTWTSGMLTGADCTLAGPLRTSGAVATTLNGLLLVNRDRLRLEGTVLRLLNGAELRNESDGELDWHAATLVEYYGGAPCALRNRGAWRQTAAGTVSVASGVALHHEADTLRVEAGTLRLLGGGACASAVALEAGALLEVQQGVWSAQSGARIAGAGWLQCSGGAVEAAADTLRVDRLRVSGSGTLQGAGRVELLAAGDWPGGTLSGSGRLVVPVGVELALGTGAAKYLFRGVDLEGEMAWSGGPLRLGSGAELAVRSGGRFDVRDALSVEYWSGALPRLLVEGELRRAAAGGAATVSGIDFDVDGGRVLVEAGELRVQASGEWRAATLDIAPAAALRFSAGTQVLAGGCGGAADGDLLLQGATWTAGSPTPLLDFAGQGLRWLAGTLNGGALVNAGRMVLDQSGAVYLDADTLRNEGLLLARTAGPLRFQNAAVLHNAPAGRVELQAATAWEYWSGLPGRVRSEGRFLRDESAGGLSAMIGALPFDLLGDTLEIRRGGLRLDGGGVFGAPAAIADTAYLQVNGGTLLAQDGAGFGPGRLLTTAGTLQVENDVAAARYDQSAGSLGGGGLFAVSSGSFSGGEWSGAGATRLTGAYDWPATVRHLYREIEVPGLLLLAGGSNRFGHGGRLFVPAGGELRLTGGGEFLHWTGALPALRVEGALTLDAPAAVFNLSALQIELDEAALDAQRGTLTVNAPCLWRGGSVTVAAGAAVSLASNTTTVADTLAGQVDGSFALNGASLQPAAAGAGLNLAGGGFVWNTGTPLPGELHNLGRLRASSAPVRYLLGTQLHNAGLLELGGGELRLQDGARLHNAAGGELAIAGAWSCTWWSGVQPTLDNDGLWRHAGPGTWTASNLPFVNRGTLRLEGGVFSLPQHPLVSQGAGARLAGDGTFAGGALLPAQLTGATAPGLSPGQLTVANGAVFDSLHALEIEIAGPVAGADYDRLTVGGNLALRGGVVATLLGGYLPAPGTEFAIATSPGLLGALDDAGPLAIDDTLYFEIEQRATELVLVTRRLAVPRLHAYTDGATTWLEWDAIPQATGYRVYVAEEGQAPALLAETAATTLDIGDRVDPGGLPRRLELFHVVSLLPEAPPATATASKRLSRVERRGDLR